MAVQTNFELWSGKSKTFSIQVENDAGTPVPLSDVTAITFYVKVRQEESGELLSKSLGSGIEVTDSENGIYEVTIGDTDLGDLDGAYYWESDVTDVSGSPYPAAYGYVAIRGNTKRGIAYCSLEEAMALMADIIINENTVPNLATAQVIVETIARDINGILLSRDVQLPVVDEQALDFLRSANQYGACAAIIKSKKPVDTGMASDKGAFGYYENKYQAKLAQLANPTFSLFTFDTAGAASVMSAGWTFGPESVHDEQSPFWTRDTTY